MKNLIYITAPDRKKKPQHSDIYLSEKLASLGIIGAQFDSVLMYGGFQRGPQLGPMIPRDASLPESNTYDRRCISFWIQLNLAHFN